MTLTEHVDSLKGKHERLERLIAEELHRPLPDQTTLSRLKREKLRIKEEINSVGTNGPLTAAAALG